MNCWSHLDALKKEAADLKHKLDSIGWTLLPATNGFYRAKKRATRAGEWEEVQSATASGLMEKVQAEIQRQEQKKRGTAA